MGFPEKFRTASVCVVLVFGAGCGGSNSSSGPTAPTSINSTQINAATVQMGKTFSAAVQAMSTVGCPEPGSDGGYQFCTVGVATDIPCSGGGTLTVTGSLNGDLAYYGTGAMTGAFTLTPTKCAIPKSSLVISGEPSLTVTGTADFFYGSATDFSITETGKIGYGPQPSGTCDSNLTIAATYGTGATCKVTGTLCGQTINQSCE